MISHTTARFRKAYRQLPVEVRRQAREAYRLFKHDPYHPGLHFKRVSNSRPIYSARVSRDYRVIGLRDGDTIVWIWIGSHSEYDKLLSQF